MTYSQTREQIADSNNEKEPLGMWQNAEGFDKECEDTRKNRGKLGECCRQARLQTCTEESFEAVYSRKEKARTITEVIW